MTKKESLAAHSPKDIALTTTKARQNRQWKQRWKNIVKLAKLLEYRDTAILFLLCSQVNSEDIYYHNSHNLNIDYHKQKENVEAHSHKDIALTTSTKRGGRKGTDARMGKSIVQLPKLS